MRTRCFSQKCVKDLFYSKLMAGTIQSIRQQENCKNITFLVPYFSVSGRCGGACFSLLGQDYYMFKCLSLVSSQLGGQSCWNSPEVGIGLRFRFPYAHNRNTFFHLGV